MKGKLIPKELGLLQLKKACSTWCIFAIVVLFHPSWLCPLYNVLMPCIYRSRDPFKLQLGNLLVSSPLLYQLHLSFIFLYCNKIQRFAKARSPIKPVWALCPLPIAWSFLFPRPSLIEHFLDQVPQHDYIFVNASSFFLSSFSCVSLKRKDSFLHNKKDAQI